MHWEGDRVEIDRCPARVVTPDVLALFRTHAMAGGRLSYSEQKSLPNPYLEAWDLIEGYKAMSLAIRKA